MSFRLTTTSCRFHSGAATRLALLYLARRRPLVIVVNDRLDHGNSFKQMIQAVPGIQSPGASGAGSIFILPAQPTPP